ncbi:hypothetical protein CDCA_CDCA04G1264 [Cyanidium caldarium]|uniref:DNA replication factor Cdt1 C-terminal domain-containing protein n=1 Tax=Cyanidium caldarium TaxID=2771 RepID=A0AAV9ISM1_CYACA|nr:hypothetical protein CDCA_CDCA04G1264 [Cyanidium caldarium]
MARLAALTVLLPEALRLQRFGTAVEDFTVELLDPECSDADRHHASINRSMGIVKRRALLRQRLRERNGREIDTRDAGVPPPPLSPTQPSAATTLSSVTRSTEASSRPTLTALLGDDTALSAMTAEAGPTHSDTTASAKRKRASPFLPPQLLQKVRRREVQRERILATEAHDQQQLALARLIRTADLVHEWCRAPPSGSLANSGGASGGRGCIPVGELVSLIQRHHPAGPLSQADAHEQLQLLARCASGWCHLERGTHTGMTLFRLERHGPRFGQVRAALLAIKSLPME